MNLQSSVCINFIVTVFLQTAHRADSNWHRDQLHTEGLVESQLRVELEESQKQLKCAHDTQHEQKNKIMSLRYITHSEYQYFSSELNLLKCNCVKSNVEND